MGSEAAREQIKMSEQQAVDRAEEIIHQAVGNSLQSQLSEACWKLHRPLPGSG